MRRLLLVLLVLLVAVPAAVAVAADDPTRTPKGWKACSGSYGSQGEAGQGFYMFIKAKRLGCVEARKVLRAYLRTFPEVGKPRRVQGFRCTLTAVSVDPDDPNGGGMAKCVRDGGKVAVRAYGHP